MAETKKEIKIPIRVRITFEIQDMLTRAAKKNQGLFVEKLVAQYIIKEGLSRRLILECVDAVHYSGFAAYNKKEKVLKKK